MNIIEENKKIKCNWKTHNEWYHLYSSKKVLFPKTVTPPFPFNQGPISYNAEAWAHTDKIGPECFCYTFDGKKLKKHF